jgi:hypothetical protein
MQSLEATFNDRHQSDYNSQLLDHLSTMSAAVTARPIHSWPDAVMTARIWETISASEGKPGITVDRSAETLAEYHELSVAQLTQFAEGGRVVDVGAGKSPFLNEFLGTASETIAVDRHRPFAIFQQNLGHRALARSADRLTPLGSGTVRLLHASFSAPFWSPTPQKARHVAAEYLRVLEPGGIALVGPTSTVDEHVHQEFYLERQGVGRSDVFPWPDSDDAPHLTHVKNAFIRTVLDSRDSTDVVGTRMIFDDEHHQSLRLMLAERHHLPNFLMLRRK